MVSFPFPKSLLPNGADGGVRSYADQSEFAESERMDTAAGPILYHNLVFELLLFLCAIACFHSITLALLLPSSIAPLL